jgi:shikimate kinase
VVLVGPRGAGKSTVGRALALRLGCAFADGDELLAAAVGMPAGDFLARRGEPAFRAEEERVTLAALRGPGAAVLALGGGAVLSPVVRQALAATPFFTVFLVAAPAVLAARIAASATRRPPLTRLPPDQEPAALLAARRPLYAAVAQQTIDTGMLAVDDAVAAVLAGLAGPLRD